MAVSPTIHSMINTATQVVSQPRPAGAALIPTRTQPQPPHSMIGMAAHGAPAVHPTSDHSVNVDENDPGLYKTDGYYIGKEREYPPSDQIIQEWDSVSESLSNHLARLTNRMKQNIPDEKKIAEPYLCMTGRKRSLYLGSIKIVLRPAVWIHCGGIRCQRKVTKYIEDLSYLRDFLNKFKMSDPIVSRHSPWTAGLTEPPNALHFPGDIVNISLAIGYTRAPDGHIPLCGARARYTIETKDNVLTHLFSTVGGEVFVPNEVYGLTTAHCLVDHLQPKLPGAEASSESSEESENLSRDSDSESDLEAVSNDTPALLPRLYSETQSEWMDIPLPDAFMYKGLGTINQDFSLSEFDQGTSDFALLNVSSIPRSVNGFCDPATGHWTLIKRHLVKHELEQGEVQIITSGLEGPVMGYLLKGDARIVLPGKVMRTRRIQVDMGFKAKHGLSGAWVIRDGNLCGVVFAAYDHAPYLHMIPAHAMFENIANALQLKQPNSAIAVADTLSHLYQDPANFTKRKNAKDEDYISWPIVQGLSGIPYDRLLEFQELRRRPRTELGPLPRRSELANDDRIRWTIPSSYENDMQIMRPVPSIKTTTAWIRAGILTTAAAVPPGSTVVAGTAAVGIISLISPRLAKEVVLALLMGHVIRNVIEPIGSAVLARYATRWGRDHLRHVSEQVDDDFFCQRVYVRLNYPPWNDALSLDAFPQKAKGACVIGAVAVEGIQPPPLDHVALAVVDTQFLSNFVSVDFAKRLGWDRDDARNSAFKTTVEEIEVIGDFGANFSLLPRDDTGEFQPLVPSMKRSSAKFFVVANIIDWLSVDVIIGLDDIVKHSLLCT